MRQVLAQRLAIVSGLAVSLAAVTSADHSWGNYHWARSTSSFTLQSGNNVDSRWEDYLDEAINDWNRSAALDLVKVPGGTRPKNCRPTSGRIEACNERYGNNGWLGIAQIWASGNHITQAITKLNDTYFDTATYNTPAWRRLVMCQEIAHDFGLDHQDETFDNENLGSCMDYTNDPDGGVGGAVNDDPSNEHPNNHDYSQLLTIYEHKDSTTTVSPLGVETAGQSDDGPAAWGRLVRSNANNRVQVYELDLGRGQKKITHVFWADPEGDARGRQGEK
jgi:hypothetical protein